MKRKLNAGNKEFSRTLRLIVCAAILCVSVWFFSTERGIWQSIPLLLVLPPFAGVLYPHRKILLPLTGIFAAFFSLIEKSHIPYTLVYTLICVAFAFSAMLAFDSIRAAAKAAGSKRILFGAASLMLAALSLCVFIFLCGTPFGNIAAQNRAKKHMEHAGFRDEIKLIGTYYQYKDGNYHTKIRFWDADIPVTAEVVTGNHGVVFDGYQNYIENKFTDLARAELSSLLRSAFPANDFLSRAGSFDNRGGAPPALADCYRDFYSSMRYDIDFFRLFPDAETFSALCREYYEFLETSGFQYHLITFYGRDVMQTVYSLTVGPGMPPTGFPPAVRVDNT